MTNNTRALLASIAALALLGIASVAYKYVPLWPKDEAVTKSVLGVGSRDLRAQILTPSGASIEGAQVLLMDVSRVIAESSFSDNAGTFKVSVPPDLSSRAEVLVRATGFAAYRASADVLSPKSQGLATITLTPLAAPFDEEYSQGLEAPIMSGWGEAFSPPQEICSEPSRPGFTIKTSTFALRGDRTCNAWATCQESVSTPTRVCWTVRLQGHNECTRGFGNCQPARESKAVLNVTFIKSSVPVTGVAYLQLTPATSSQGAQLCEALKAVGLGCPAPQTAYFSGVSRVVFFAPGDEALAKRAAETLESVVGPVTIMQGESSGSASQRGLLSVWVQGVAGEIP